MSTQKYTILLVGNTTPRQRRIRATLQSEGYIVLRASSYSRAVAVAHGYQPDLVLLDMDLAASGNITGFECCVLIRQTLNMPIIACAEQIDMHSKIRAFDLGMDDFLTDPWGMDELLARIRACLRRVYRQGRTAPRENVLYSYDRVLCLDVAARQVYLCGKGIYLPAKEFDLLYILLLHAGKVLTYDFLLQQVWGERHHEEKEKDYVRVCICNLRKKISHLYIITQPGVGYLFPDTQEVLRRPTRQTKVVDYRQGA